jgi:hypothetical protein
MTMSISARELRAHFGGRRGGKTQRLRWPAHPARRVYTVFNREHRSLGCWSDEAAARAEFAKHPGATLVIADEYHAHEYGHQMRIVVAEERAS